MFDLQVPPYVVIDSFRARYGIFIHICNARYIYIYTYIIILYYVHVIDGNNLIRGAKTSDSVSYEANWSGINKWTNCQTKLANEWHRMSYGLTNIDALLQTDGNFGPFIRDPPSFSRVVGRRRSASGPTSTARSVFRWHPPRGGTHTSRKSLHCRYSFDTQRLPVNKKRSLVRSVVVCRTQDRVQRRTHIDDIDQFPSAQILETAFLVSSLIVGGNAVAKVKRSIRRDEWLRLSPLIQKYKDFKRARYTTTF